MKQTMTKERLEEIIRLEPTMDGVWCALELRAMAPQMLDLLDALRLADADNARAAELQGERDRLRKTLATTLKVMANVQDVLAEQRCIAEDTGEPSGTAPAQAPATDAGGEAVPSPTLRPSTSPDMELYDHRAEMARREPEPPEPNAVIEFRRSGCWIDPGERRWDGRSWLVNTDQRRILLGNWWVALPAAEAVAPICSCPYRDNPKLAGMCDPWCPIHGSQTATDRPTPPPGHTLTRGNVIYIGQRRWYDHNRSWSEPAACATSFAKPFWIAVPEAKADEYLCPGGPMIDAPQLPEAARRSMPGGKIWSCKIGQADADSLPDGADMPMRQAVMMAYRSLTGRSANVIFSGWGAELTPAEKNVVFGTPLPQAEPVPADAEPQVDAESNAELTRVVRLLTEAVATLGSETPGAEKVVREIIDEIGTDRQARAGGGTA